MKWRAGVPSPAGCCGWIHRWPCAVLATACWRATLSSLHHRRCQPLRAAARTAAAVRRARWRNSNLSKCWQSLRQRPPISHARTRRRWPPPRFGASSGYRRCLRRFAAVMAAAPTRGAVGMGAPVRVKGETRVICTIVTIAGSQEGGKDIVDTRTTVMNCVPLLA